MRDSSRFGGGLALGLSTTREGGVATHLVGVSLQYVDNLPTRLVADRLSRPVVLRPPGRLARFSLKELVELLLVSLWVQQSDTAIRPPSC